MRVFLFGVAIVVCGAIFSVWSYNKPLPELTAATTLGSIQKSQKVSINWPTKGQAAISAEGYGVLGATSGQKPVPMASTAKIMLALAVLRQHPIKSGQTGETITLDSQDVAALNKEIAREGSRVVVKSGEKISEYDALEALLLPSANNMAYSLARWAFGSEDAYLAYANDLADSLGMKDTHFADASGFSPKTVSTANDLVILGDIAMQRPAITEIVAKRTATIPVAGLVYNVNTLVGHNDIVGIKTGNTDQAGGCYVFAAKHKFASGQTITFIGAVTDANDLSAAMNASLPILDSVYAGFKQVTVLKKGDEVGYYTSPDGVKASAVTTGDLRAFVWKGNDVKQDVVLDKIRSPKDANTTVGTVSLGSSKVNVELSSDLPVPSAWWRIAHFSR